LRYVFQPQAGRALCLNERFQKYPENSKLLGNDVIAS
jgi:hypothetical protein